MSEELKPCPFCGEKLEAWGVNFLGCKCAPAQQVEWDSVIDKHFGAYGMQGPLKPKFITDLKTALQEAITVCNATPSWPLASEEDRRSGWTLDSEFLRALKAMPKVAEWELDLEHIEAVLLAVSASI